ncbi:hypothetical protein HBI23_198800 [Parastagonospora nodorum]|nr:hypothetical protein HBI47_128170 [Parastagonospora nodorum]KAH5641469.1 hypothetical protein HBI23_198800 [Parastagonospora nodorum]
MGLTFLPRPQPQPRKRSRAIADIDGEHSCLQKKKRRLRLFLITSRLSPQFSHPATNIVDRGSSKIAVWAKQKSLGRNLLRKAAILNHIRRGVISAEERGVQPRQVLVEQEREQNELALAKLEFNYGSIDTYTRPVTSRMPSVPPSGAVRTRNRFVVSGSPTSSPTSSRSPSPTPSSPPLGASQDDHVSDYRSPNEAFASLLPRAQVPRKDYLPLPPSPLGLSNYDAFDADDDPYPHLDDDDDESSVNLFDEDEDADSVPFSPSAVAETSISSHTGASHLLNTPLLLVPPDLDILDHSEPVFGDYDQVDGGEHAAWPSNSAETTTRSATGSSSPDFHALFATAHAKRTDSFATSPNFRPVISKSPLLRTSRPVSRSPNFSSAAPSSPNFAPTSLSACVSPNFAPVAASPNFTSTVASPNFTSTVMSPNFGAAAVSPNLIALDTPIPTPRRMSTPSAPRPEFTHSAVNAARKQQRNPNFSDDGS